jgi:hypothetical protein
MCVCVCARACVCVRACKSPAVIFSKYAFCPQSVFSPLYVSCLSLDKEKLFPIWFLIEAGFVFFEVVNQFFNIIQVDSEF